MKTTEELRQVTQSLNGILGPAVNIEAVARVAIAASAESFGCHWATYWKVDADALILRAIATWSEDAAPLAPLRRDTETRALTLSEGVAGHVWRSGKPVCTNDLARDMCLPRSLDARSAGCISGIWIPIRVNDTTYGVIELLGKHAWANTPAFIEQLATLGDSIGRMIPSRPMHAK
jgi:hypothetical protein